MGIKFKLSKNWIFISAILLVFSSCKEQQVEIESSTKTRTEKWVADIAFFENQYLNASKTFPEDSISKARVLLSNLKTQIETRSDNQIKLQLSKCVAMANNGHTTIHLSGMDKIPVRFYWFADGLHIIKTDAEAAKYLGAKVLSINKVQTETVFNQLKPYLSGIERFKRFTATNYLSSPKILNGIGFGEENSMQLTLLKGSDTLEVSFKAKEMPNSKYEYETWADLQPDTSDEKAWRHVLDKKKSLPIYLKKMNEGVFYSFFDSEKIAYFSINALWYQSEDFEGQIEEFLDKLKTKSNYNIVLDLRYFTGGDYLIPTKLATKPPKIIGDNNKIYLVTSPMTFSAGLVTAARVKYFGEDKVVIVGEEVGDNLKFWAEGDYYQTPNFGIEIQDSKYEHDWQDDTFTLGKTFWVNGFYGVAAKSLRVNKEIKMSYEDYLDGRDPILEWIYKEN